MMARHPIRNPLFRSLALILLSILSAWPAMAYDGELFTVCKLDPQGENFLALRACPSSQCQMLAKLRPGTFLWTFSPHSERGWRHVGVMLDFDDKYTPQGPSGYVFDSYICYIDLSR